jgi:myo-inositol-1(or 4)-monophosphatase
MSTELLTLLGQAHEALDAVTSLVRGRQISDVSAKGDRDMLTDLDLLVERTARARLQQATPHLGFFGEEEGQQGNGDATWVLDPIDGTANFIHGIPLVGISLAMVREEQPVLGIIDLPVLRQRYWAAEGHGAFRDGTPIAAAPVRELADAIISVGDYAYGDDAASRNIAAFAVHRALAATAQRVRMLGSAAVDLAWVADGTLAASVTLSNNDWDMAAGIAIARQAGAIVTDINGTPHSTRSSATIATAPGLSGNLLTVLADAAAAHSRSITC